MEHAWIPIAIFAALMQSVRTAAQKTLNQRMSNLATTYVRSLFGLPLLAAYLVLVLAIQGGGAPAMSLAYLGYTFLGSLAQVLATMLLIYMFKLRTFAVGTLLTKVDIVITAALGAALFSERLSLAGLIALLIVLAGVLAMSLAKTGKDGLTAGATLREALTAWPTQVALMCAFLFTLSYLFLREATLVMSPGSALWKGAWTVLIAVAMQVAGVGLWLRLSEPTAFGAIWPNRAIATFIGVTSALGSIGWFTAFAMQNASYVRAVGQVEVVFTILISALYFKETIKPLEYVGMALTVAGVLIFRLAY
jgi:drug/metabolite transporter (DMT)-like permease